MFFMLQKYKIDLTALLKTSYTVIDYINVSDFFPVQFQVNKNTKLTGLN